jgi:hypothetical protein
MTTEELEAKVKILEDRLRTLEDIEEIKQLQRIYGYYLDNRMGDEIIDLFSDDTELVDIGGVYLGKEGVRRLFKGVYGGGLPPGHMGQHGIQQAVINVDEGGKTAKGRWRVVWCMAAPVDDKIAALWGHGLYENEYIKENGKWLFKKFQCFLLYRTPYEDGWVKTPVAGLPQPSDLPEELRPDRPPAEFRPYPARDVVPFHYKHPITGKWVTPGPSKEG